MFDRARHDNPSSMQPRERGAEKGAESRPPPPAGLLLAITNGRRTDGHARGRGLINTFVSLSSHLLCLPSDKTAPPDARRGREETPPRTSARPLAPGVPNHLLYSTPEIRPCLVLTADRTDRVLPSRPPVLCLQSCSLQTSWISRSSCPLGLVVDSSPRPPLGCIPRSSFYFSF